VLLFSIGLLPVHAVSAVWGIFVSFCNALNVLTCYTRPPILWAMAALFLGHPLSLHTYVHMDVHTEVFSHWLAVTSSFM